MTVRETVLQALQAALFAGGVPVLRGEVFPERVPAEGLAILRDGDPGEPEVSLSPPTYYYQHRAEIEVVTSGPMRDTAFDQIVQRIGAALAGNRTLGGVCEWAEGEAPRPIDIAVDGGAPLKAASITVVLHYVTGDPLG